MKNLRICIYGGTDLQAPSSEFITELTRSLLESIPGCTIITGGFLRKNEFPDAKSTDDAALDGARQYAQKYSIDLRQCFEAWIPEPVLDSRRDAEGVERMSEEEGITVRVMQGRTPLGRRLAMVSGVDLVITISGRRHTEVVVEQALELGVPVLPIPDFGGDSKKLLTKYEERLAAAFDHEEFNICLKTLSETINSDYKTAASAVVLLIKTAKLEECLILHPYDEKHDRLYKTIVEPSVAKHMIPVRLDQLPGSEEIYSRFAKAIRSSSAVIVDITQLNENVMYEIGYARGLGLDTLLYTHEADRRQKLPVYLRTLDVKVVDEQTPLGQLINDHLISVRAKRRLPV